MTHVRLFAVVLMLAAAPSLAQKNESDAQGPMIVKQTIDAAGGLDVLSRVQDFKGAGTITYYWTEEIQGPVVVKGKGRSFSRLDASLPGGLRSIILRDGKGYLKQPGDTKLILDPLHVVISPHLALVEALSSASNGVRYVRLVKHHGRLCHDIQVVDYRTGGIGTPVRLKVDYFVDPLTFLIAGMRESVPGTPPLARQWHEVDFDDYRRVDGALIPFSITERVHEQRLSSIMLTEFVLNANITTDDFEP
jgi:hypothetical protein